MHFHSLTSTTIGGSRSKLAHTKPQSSVLTFQIEMLRPTVNKTFNLLTYGSVQGF